jgi:uncharacterized membrane protein YdbT with pleckstrin-like domain
VSFPQDALTADEELVLALHPHFWYLAKSGGSLLLAVVLGAVVAMGGPEWLSWLSWILGVAIVVCLLWFLVSLAQWATTYFVLTSQRVIYRSGLVSKKGTEIPLDGISAVLFSQRVFERMLGLGDVTIQSSAREGDAVFDDIRRPSQVQKAIYEEISANEDRRAQRLSGYVGTHMPQQAPAPAAPSAADQISQLAALREQGHITEEEFQAKKAELLRRM